MSDATPTILVVEDDAVTRDAMVTLLRADGYQVVTADGGNAGFAAIERATPSLVISDVHMADGDGTDLVAHVRARPRATYVPILLVSALDNVAERVAALDRGADDFLPKPVDPRELLARVRVHLRQARREHELERRAVIDPLTGVPNRRGIFAVLHREQERTRRSGAATSVLMIDVDHFKRLNDELGHQAGDTALRQIAAALGLAIRAVDHVGRIGGDEFLIVLPESDAAAAEALATRLRALRLPPPAPAARSMTVSVGVATLGLDETLDAVVERADHQMYRIRRTAEIPQIEPTR